MGCCMRAAPALLLHANILLVMYVGALLVLGARLAWDPSLYLAARALAPSERLALQLAAPLLAAALLLAAHLAAAATLTRSPRLRRALLLIYALWITVAWGCQLGALGYVGSRVAPLAADGGARLRRVADDVRALLALLAQYHPLPQQLQPLFEEVWADLPRNGYCAGAAVAFLLVLQPTAAVAALLARAAVPLRKKRKGEPLLSNDSVSSGDSRCSEQRRLKAVYRGGKLALV